eukprot:CAMPEP_0114572780 /NCGR_PEP_ID=MMETSP0114-20121206/18488_1 /TAXON_ID=31324 /ORGANISM="Goniomonas sp, Strain m" /LENGTH=111 /DNA_ID=CAMNT_0001760041 /DNA_START=140 /DNA_END=476 /DNA_ORIENTATION=-
MSAKRALGARFKGGRGQTSSDPTRPSAGKPTTPPLGILDTSAADTLAAAKLGGTGAKNDCCWGGTRDTRTPGALSYPAHEPSQQVTPKQATGLKVLSEFMGMILCILYWAD